MICRETDPQVEADEPQPTLTIQEDHNEEIPEEVLECSTLPLCVIGRVLTGQKKPELEADDWLWNNIFHTRVEHNERALNLIIDNGSSMNIISKDIVRKLELPLEKHPQPFKLSWVDDTSIPVMHHYSLTFSLGNSYEDTLWCDVIPMQACHVLLGRPWLYDRRVLYDGFVNTYTFLYKDKKIVLKPMRIQDFNSPSNEARVLSLRQFSMACQDHQVILAVLAKSVMDEVTLS